ncbi:hypothetical protein GCM10011491_29150 [Brucella endophytica]|uniref:Lytic murein transglycosylase n=1 Tax=Brucella endophytica TaxID=1963359 RepID=A0A916SGH3_9HYPH|nr:hypothetical protein GCM10011491_29150 [Brucella endophytica]
METLAPYGAPLCPAGHLPRKGGDYAIINARHQSQTFQNWSVKAVSANLPPCGGDVRQDRGGRRRAPASPFINENY